MSKYAVLIDDGEAIASDAGVAQKTITEVTNSTLRTAVQIASERISLAGGRQVLTCQVRDDSTGETRSYEVVVTVTPSEL